MWRWGIVALVVLMAPGTARAATPVVVAHGPLLALSAHDGVAYAVVERDSAARPFALVRSSGKGAGSAIPFGGPGAENVDLAQTPQGVEVAWSRPVSSAFEFFVARATDLADPETPGLGTGPPQLAGDAI